MLSNKLSVRQVKYRFRLSIFQIRYLIDDINYRTALNSTFQVPLVVSNRGIDILGPWVDKIIVASVSGGTGTGKQELCNRFMDEVWQAAMAAQMKRTDARIVQGFAKFKLILSIEGLSHCPRFWVRR
jgi:hypothetical protein